MRIDDYVIIGLASEAKYGCNDICINLTKSDIKTVSGYNSVRLTLADALLLPLSFLLPPPPQPGHVITIENVIGKNHSCTIIQRQHCGS